MKRWLISLSLAALAFAAHALPSVTEVEAQVRGGNYTQAESMMHDVVAAKPDSARAHYVYAEILAHNARFADAAREAATAKRLDPSLKFASPEKFSAFEQLLEREQRRAPATGRPSLQNLGPTTSTLPAPLPQRQAVTPIEPTRQAQPAALQRSGVPGWIWLVGLAAIGWLLWRMLRGRRSAGSAVAPAAGAAPYGAGPGYGSPYPQPYGPGGVAPPGGVAGPFGGSAPGGGLMGAGLAAAGGVAAGMLAERLLERGRDSRDADRFSSDRDAYVNPAPQVDPDARALEERDVDFGAGGNDWDAGSSDGGSIDVGGGSDDNW